MGVAAVYAAATARAEAVAAPPLNLYERGQNGDKEYALKDARYSLIHDEWNEDDNTVEAREFMQTCYDLRGNGVAEVQWGNGVPRRIVPIQPGDYRVERDEASRQVAFFIRKPDGGERKVLREKILHVRNHRLGGYMGESVISLHRDTIERSMAQTLFARKVFENSANPSGVIQHPLTIGDEGVDRLRRQWEEQYMGVDNAGRPMILEEGAVWNRVSMSPLDAQFVENSKLTVLDICRIFKVPPHILCEFVGATFSNIEEQNRDFYTRVLMYLYAKWEAALNRALLLEDERGRLYFKFNMNVFLRGNTETRYRTYGYGRQWGFLCVDDIRELEDMNKLPDGKGQVFLQPQNMAEAGAELPDPNEMPSPPKGKDNNVAPLKQPAPKAKRDDAAHLEVITQALRRCVNRECSALRKKVRSTGGGAEFREFYSTFYQNDLPEYWANEMAPALRAYRAHCGLGHVSDEAIEDLQRDFVMRGMQQIQEIDDDGAATETLLTSWFESRAIHEAQLFAAALRGIQSEVNEYECA